MRASRIAGWGRRVGAWAGVAGTVTLLSATSAQAQQQAIDPTWLSFDAAARSARFQLIAGLPGPTGGRLPDFLRRGGARRRGDVDPVPGKRVREDARAAHACPWEAMMPMTAASTTAVALTLAACASVPQVRTAVSPDGGIGSLHRRTSWIFRRPSRRSSRGFVAPRGARRASPAWP